MRNLFVALLMMIALAVDGKNTDTISLIGKWELALDSTDVGVQENWFSRSFTDQITLPGTLDDARKGNKNKLLPSLDKPQVLHLTRKYSYVGPAWYKKEVIIPANWKDKNVYLNLERVLWETSVWVDGKKVEAKGESLVAPQSFNLTGLLSPGRHTITLRIDNRKKYDISTGDLGHAYTNATQIMWNGVIGDLNLTAEGRIAIRQVNVYPDIKQKCIRVRVHVSNTAATEKGTITASVRLKGGQTLGRSIIKKDLPFDQKEQTVELTYPMGDSFLLWSEHTPNVYELSVALKTKHSKSLKHTTFGMRELRQKNAALYVNDKRVFMRGTLECCIFPLTGYPAMDKAGWKKIMGTAREWGLNHLRFHSWCPPKAAFEVADELGFYLQVELPLWSLTVGKDPATNQFLYDEGARIIAEYGNHPSFCFFSMGNELQPDFIFLRDLMVSMRNKDPRHLYTTTSYTFERGHGTWPEADDDFFITQRTKNGWVRGQGVFNAEPPRFDKDYIDAVKGMRVPLITHEIGQYAVYPNLDEIKKYTGVLDPLNFKGVKQDLEAKGLIHKASSYLNASGKLSALLYKEEIERALKTPGCSGVQLLDLHDFPGQGTALVGLLDAFWDSKGLIDPSEFRQFCSSVVPLIRYPKATYMHTETFKADVEIANYSASELKNRTILWELKDSKGVVKGRGSIEHVDIPIGNNRTIGKIQQPLNGIKQADELALSVSIAETEIINSWKIWVYPESLTIEKGNVVVTSNEREAKNALKEGKSVLYNPSYKTLIGLEGKFVPVFWSPVHFPKQAGTMGILCDPKHKLFEYFPTRMHTDWQWWHLLISSKTIITDAFYQDIEPIIECVDNFSNNRRLTTLFETKCENGKLIVCSMDLSENLAAIPEKRQLLYSILRYMNSTAFNPEKQISFQRIKSLTGESESERSSADSIY